MSSRRLPGKVLRPLLGRPMLERQLERVRRCPGLEVAVVTSRRRDDDAIAELCRALDVRCYRGPLDDVLARFVGALDGWAGDPVVRLTGDCPLADPALIADAVERHRRSGAAYSANILERHLPDGLDVEVIERETLRQAARESRDAEEREHVTLYLRRHPERFRQNPLRQTPGDFGALRWTVDTAPDFAFVEGVYRALYPANPTFGWRDVLRWAHPHLAAAAAPDTRWEASPA